MKKKRREPSSQMGKLGPAMEAGDSGMAGMSLLGMTLRGKPDRMGGMSRGMTERRPIGVNKMSQGVPGIPGKKKSPGEPSKARRRGSARMGM